MNITDTDIATNTAARLCAIDRALGVAFRPAANSNAAAAAGSGPALGVGETTLEEIEAQARQAFPFTESLSSATQLVFGEGTANADLVFVGEAPGADEDRTGRPFVGAAGQKLDQIIAAMGLARADVYICNVLKARPPRNRAPLPDEVAANASFLKAQLRCIAPKVIVALGGPAARFLLSTDTGITRLRGNWGAWTSSKGDEIAVMPTFHPAYLLRNYTPEVRGQVWHDMKQVIDRIGFVSQSG